MKAFCTLILALAAGCSSDDTAPGDARRQVAQLDAHLSLGEAVTVGNLKVWPVFTDEPLELGEFLTLQEALEKKVAEVREVASQSGQTIQVIEIEEDNSAPAQESDNSAQTESGQQELDSPFNGPSTNAAIGGGSVNTLEIENKGDLPILICAGTVVTGGNQDRQIGQDIVVKAKSTVPVDVFCVEQGRWSNERLGKKTDGQFKAASTNAMIGVRSKGQYEVAQDGVWEEVAKVKQTVVEKMKIRGQMSETQLASVVTNSSLAIALSANDSLTGKEIDAVCSKIRAHFGGFGKKNAPVGFAYAINGKPVNVRAFANSAVFDRQLDPFLHTMATESLLAPKVEHDAAEASAVVALVREIENAEEVRRETAALNWNGVRRNLRGYAANCYVPSLGAASGKKLAVTRDWTAR
jgi:hypothetical protein